MPYRPTDQHVLVPDFDTVRVTRLVQLAIHAGHVRCDPGAAVCRTRCGAAGHHCGKHLVTGDVKPSTAQATRQATRYVQSGPAQ